MRSGRSWPWPSACSPFRRSCTWSASARSGPYSDGALGAFLADFYGDLLTLAPATLVIALGPVAVVLAWRLLRRLAGLG